MIHKCIRGIIQMFRFHFNNHYKYLRLSEHHWFPYVDKIVPQRALIKTLVLHIRRAKGKVSLIATDQTNVYSDVDTNLFMGTNKLSELKTIIWYSCTSYLLPGINWRLYVYLRLNIMHILIKYGVTYSSGPRFAARVSQQNDHHWNLRIYIERPLFQIHRTFTTERWIHCYDASVGRKSSPWRPFSFSVIFFCDSCMCV